MSWQLASFLILGLGLACGFAWYDRSQPSARVLALVAALAALVVVGRIAFAPIPNVKPTTDMILFAGYALGAAPGFAVGAIATLASNVFFTQGPWTPWQMAAWGSVGIGGAALARVTRGRELGRWPLALACAVAGVWFGLALDTHHWTLGAEQTLDSWLAVAATSFPYNVAHVVGNIVFCLLIGPAFVRALQRYKRRFEVSWERPPAAATASLVLALALAGSLLAAEPARADAAGSAARYLAQAQGADGGFGSTPRGSSNQADTTWAALGLAAAGRNPADVKRGRRSVIQYLRANVRELREPQDLERGMLVLAAAGLDAREFAGRNLVRDLLRDRDREGSIQGILNRTTFAILALRAAGEPPGDGAIRRMVRWIVPQQQDDGGFGLEGTNSSDIDTTGGVLQALDAAGRRDHPAVRRAVAYLRRVQNPDGGFGQMRGRSSNAQSTAWAVQGLLAAGRNPESLRRDSRTPLAYIASLQSANGSIRYSRTSAQTPVWVTSQALLALERKPFPLERVARRRRTRAQRESEPASGSKPAGRKASREPAAEQDEQPAPTMSTPRPRRPLPVVTGEPAGSGAPDNGGNEEADAAVLAAGVAGISLAALGGWLWWRRRLARRRAA